MPRPPSRRHRPRARPAPRTVADPTTTRARTIAAHRAPVHPHLRSPRASKRLVRRPRALVRARLRSPAPGCDGGCSNAVDRRRPDRLPWYAVSRRVQRRSRSGSAATNASSCGRSSGAAPLSSAVSDRVSTADCRSSFSSARRASAGRQWQNSSSGDLPHQASAVSQRAASPGPGCGSFADRVFEPLDVDIETCAQAVALSDGLDRRLGRAWPKREGRWSESSSGPRRVGPIPTVRRRATRPRRRPAGRSLGWPPTCAPSGEGRHPRPPGTPRAGRPEDPHDHVSNVISVPCDRFEAALRPLGRDAACDQGKGPQQCTHSVTPVDSSTLTAVLLLRRLDHRGGVCRRWQSNRITSSSASTVQIVGGDFGCDPTSPARCAGTFRTIRTFTGDLEGTGDVTGSAVLLGRRHVSGPRRSPSSREQSTDAAVERWSCLRQGSSIRRRARSGVPGASPPDRAPAISPRCPDRVRLTQALRERQGPFVAADRDGIASEG